MGLTRTHTLGLRVDALAPFKMPDFLGVDAVRPALITFVNPACVVIAERSPTYRGLLNEFGAVLPDGIGMCLAIRLLHRLPAARISFDTTSLALPVFARVMRDGLTVALVGGRPGIAEKAAEQLRRAFSGVQITATLDGYGDHNRKISELKESAPDVVVCGMGAGAQEQFLADLAEAGWSGVGFTCGGYLDQLADGLHYYPRWVDRANLRWAYRLAREPRRLARRYGIDYSLFAVRLSRAWITQAARRERQERAA